MTPPIASNNWTLLGDLSIRNVKLYDGVELPLNDANCLFASCPHGGPIAIGVSIKEPNTPPNKVPNAWRLGIYSGDGRQRFGTIQASAIAYLFWSNSQKLILVGPQGRVLLYSAQGKHLNTFSIGKDETQELGLFEAKTFCSGKETGLAIMNAAHHIFAMNSINSRVEWRIQDTERRAEPPTCWAVLSSPLTPTSVLVCAKTKFYLGILEAAATPIVRDWALTTGSYVAMEPNKEQALALVHNSGVVQVVDSVLQSLLHTIDLTSGQLQTLDTRPIWCASSVILFQTSVRSLQFHALNNASYTFNFPQPIRVGPDTDGLRVFTQHSVHFLSPVPEALEHVLGLASARPGALLFEASQKLERNDHTFYEYIKLIGADSQMTEAVDECLATAANHFDPAVQTAVLKAASMGMMLCDRYDKTKFVRTAKTLRVLNAVRRFGLPISFGQLKELSTLSLVDRLSALGHWPLAIQVCGQMDIEMEDGVYRVLRDWCLAIMKECVERKQESLEEVTARRIFSRLEPYSGISYADIADVAAKKGLQQLAALLLDREPNLSRQVTVLIKLKQVDKALSKAVLSQQPDLLHLVLRHLLKTNSSKEVELLLRKSPQALSLYQSYIHEEAPDKVLTLYEQGDDFARQAIHHLCKAQADSKEPFSDCNKTIELLAKAEEALKQMKDPSAAQLVASCSQLLAQNAKREERYSTSLVDKTLRETFIWAVGNAEEGVVEGLRKSQKVGDKQNWQWTVEGLARVGRWQQLEKFGRSPKRSPVGYLGLIEACCRHNNPNLAVKFMDKITSYEEQVKALLIMGKIMDAAALAAKKSDINMLQHIRRTLAHDSDEWRQVTQVIQQTDR